MPFWFHPHIDILFQRLDAFNYGIDKRKSHYLEKDLILKFRYHAYGSDVGTLNVFKLEKSGIQGKYEKLFSISGDQGNEWHVTQINFYVKSYQDFNIVIEGIVGDDGYYDYGWSGGKGDISIDDFEIRDKECQPIGDCDFEEDTCNYFVVRNLKLLFNFYSILGAWKNAEKDADFEWIRNRGSTPSSFSGPSVDHTLGTSRGTYLFIETSSQSKQGSKALMVSPVFDRFTQRCFEFYYHMYEKLAKHKITLNILFLIVNNW